MLRLPLAAMAVLLMIPQAQALCLSVPEDAAWQGAQRQTAHTLCLHRELSRATESRADEVRWKALLDALAARAELLLQQQRAATMLLKQ
jgi:hypothetical protein